MSAIIKHVGTGQNYIENERMQSENTTIQTTGSGANYIYNALSVSGGFPYTLPFELA